MNCSRITKTGFLLLGTAMLAWPAPAMAGFEFTAPKAPVKKQQAIAPEDAITAPMPIVPTETVTAEPLIAPEDMPLAAADDSTDEREPVYIRRQRTNAMLKAPKNQPMDTAALLKATENGDMVELEGQPRPNLAEPAPSGGALVINPYPLDSEQGATHGGGDMGKIATEQAMMEEGGNLRTVAVPGKKAPGMIARAKMTSRYDSASQYMDRAPVRKNAVAEEASSMMTPIPGGEGEPLRDIVAQPLPAPKAIAPAPTPLPIAARTTVPTSAPVKTAAMPVSAQQSAAPAPVTVPPSAQNIPAAPSVAAAGDEHETSATPLIPSRVSSANTTAMPRPARPEGALPPVVMKAAAPAQPASQPPAPVQPKSAPAQYAEAVGFGRDLPLALALSQIVPPEYSYAFGADVNVGAVVSWQGGKPWNQVLDDTLAQQGLRAVISDTQITIVKSGKAA